ncbi:MAG: hypothetical protein LBS01_02280 [Prevotellaceae bacterium]|jgi:hypothetical protein|nr:hypothetical protein [Prevotellaceae bacterium]
MKKILFTLLIINVLHSVSAQTSQSGTANTAAGKSWFDPQRITVGGAVGGAFSNKYTAVQIAPQIGYNFTNYFNAGAGVQYAYYGLNYDNQSEKRHYAGLNLYGRVTIANYFALMVQPEINRLWRSYDGQSGTELVPVLIVGAGVRLSNVFMMLQYDIVQSDYSPYSRSIFYSIGFAF